MKLIHPNVNPLHDKNDFMMSFHNLGWKDYMLKYLPEHKRGGPAKQPSRKRRNKKRERQATIR